MRSPLRWPWILMLVFMLTSCATPSVQINRNYDFNRVKRVAVLGFDSYTGEPESGDMVTVIIEKKLLQVGLSLVERAKVEKVIKEQNFSYSGFVSQDEAIKIGRLLGVQALVMGSVTVFKKDQTAQISVPIKTKTREPVIAQKTIWVDRNGTKVAENVDVVIDYKVTEDRRVEQQYYRLEAECGVVAKMIDVETGEIIWVGNASDEGANVQVAAEYAVDRITRSLSKALKTSPPTLKN